MMILKKIILSVTALGSLTACASEPAPQVWEINSLSQIGGHAVSVLGNPQLIDTDYGKAVAFDGDGDRLLVANNPLAGAEAFTVEIIFRPRDVWPANPEPRFFHIEAADNPDRRLTIELRLNDRKEWYLDTYIKSEKSQAVLIDDSLVHPVNEWAHAAVTYQGRQMTAYVNGRKELTAEVDYLPIAPEAATSIGARMNQVHWFNGDILLTRVTHAVLAPEDFLTMEKLPKQ